MLRSPSTNLTLPFPIVATLSALPDHLRSPPAYDDQGDPSVSDLQLCLLAAATPEQVRGALGLPLLMTGEEDFLTLSYPYDPGPGCEPTTVELLFRRGILTSITPRTRS